MKKNMKKNHTQKFMLRFLVKNLEEVNQQMNV